MKQGPKRKILLYVPSLSGGGAERVSALLTNGFTAVGDEVIVAVDYLNTDHPHIFDKNVAIHVLGRAHGKSVIGLARLLRREKPDVAHSVLCLANLKLTLAAALNGQLSRVVMSYHGFFSSEPQKLSRISYLLTPILTRITGATISVSDALQRHLLDEHHAAPRKLTRIYNPVEIRLCPQAEKDNPPMVLACGRLTEEKDFSTLLRAFALIESKDAQLTILGEGSLRPALEAQIAQLGLAGRVHMPGYVTDPARYYGRASCLVISSLRETFSLVLVEALAHGLPVISTRCGGPEEILADSRTGMLVPCNDPTTLAAAIQKALATPWDAGPGIARAGDFTTQVAVAEYGRVFDQIIARQRSRPRGAPVTGGSAIPKSRS
ncbi:MAG: glycosyltransferase [Hyphomicrobiales bacterium]|nr:glycosyltransferase [Hyphomicrobiales bacterium]MDE2115603.1 glycosyltransferase [Hyphomicrobiales bacterium]